MAGRSEEARGKRGRRVISREKKRRNEGSEEGDERRKVRKEMERRACDSDDRETTYTRLFPVPVWTKGEGSNMPRGKREGRKAVKRRK